MPKLNVLVAGSTGYIGVQLIKLLIKHSDVKIKYLCGNSSVGKNISSYEKRAQHAALLEELIKYNPSCFVASVKKLDPKSCEKIEESYLSEPFFYPREDLKASLATAKDFKASCLAS